MEDNKHLSKNLSIFQVYAIACGAIFTGLGYMDGVFYYYCGQGTWLAFLLMTLGVLPIALIYCKLVPLFHQNGGELIYNTVGVNKHWGFLSAWFVLACWLVTPIACIMGIVQWISMILGAELSIGIQLVIYITFIIMITTLSLNKIDIAGKVQSVMLVLAIGFCLLTSLLLFFSGDWSIANFGGVSNMFKTQMPSQLGIPGWFIGCAMLIMPFFGFETVPQMLEEGNFPAKKGILAILGSIATCGVVYSLLFVALCGTGTYEELSNATPDGFFLTIYWMKEKYGWAIYTLLFGFGSVFCAIVTSLLGFWIACARMIYSMGSENFLPKSFCKLNNKQQPILPNIFIAVINILFAISIAIGSSIVDFTNLMSFGCSVAYTMTILSAMIMRRKHPQWFGKSTIASMALEILSLAVAFSIAFFCTLGQSANSWLCFAVYMVIGVAIWMYMAFTRWSKTPIMIETPEGKTKF